ncbi:hypothetical protein K435DRAFT_775773 [Dendrothele bispora CBS 962.96]|uniref:Uncharacterized protein n=1 Tax=Dendrothele bispora (strain CBS 962.96) TaxID=1314807 RepID=A0A4V4HHC7_DENBC|nr:hypothetical protein K435DRAFT_776747 [Dendrothele bispora CBS 962.96]THV02036.1 hypothetical protein K435DRAFT_775773 [Dendrothele bispora CBS 962.96]
MSTTPLCDHVSQIPSEILSEIFLSSIDDPMDDPRDVEHTIYRPLIISHISRYCRDVALSTPRLWSRLFLPISSSISYHGHNIQAQTEIAEAWLARSASCPLQLHISWAEKSTATSHPVLDSIIRHSIRWSRVSLYLPPTAFSSLTPIKGNLPLLQDLSLGCNDLTLTSVSGNPYTTFHLAPELRSFECIDISPFQFLLPYNQITSLPLCCLSIPECLELQNRCTHLSSAMFILGLGGTTLDLFRPISSPSMRQAVFTTSHRSTFVDLNPLLQHCTYPNLSSFQLSNFKVSPAPDLPGFLSRAPLLTTLDIQKVTLSDRNLLDCIRETPNLMVLRVVEEMERWRNSILFSEDVLHAMTFPSSHPESHQASGNALLPNLQHINLSLIHTSAAAFLSMVESRSFDPTFHGPDDNVNEGVSMLRSIELDVQHWSESSVGIWTRTLTGSDSAACIDGIGVEERLERLRDRGLDINVDVKKRNSQLSL